MLQKCLPSDVIQKKCRRAKDVNSLWKLVSSNFTKEQMINGFNDRLFVKDELKEIFGRSKLNTQDMIKMISTARTFGNARNSYSPESKINTPVKYFMPVNGGVDGTAWGKWCNNSIKHIKLDGAHFTIWKKPFVKKFAEKLNKLLQ